MPKTSKATKPTNEVIRIAPWTRYGKIPELDGFITYNRMEAPAKRVVLTQTGQLYRNLTEGRLAAAKANNLAADIDTLSRPVTVNYPKSRAGKTYKVKSTGKTKIPPEQIRDAVIRASIHTEAEKLAKKMVEQGSAATPFLVTIGKGDIKITIACPSERSLETAISVLHKHI